MKNQTRLLSGFLGLFCAFSLMIVFLITSVEAVAYWTPDYYEQEYTKYHVDQTVHMEMDDLLDVTDEMMAYLRGRREDLHVSTVVDGQPREFFNDREIAHMEDVRGLFLGGLALRRICLALAAACILGLFLLRAPVRKVLPRMICVGTLLFLGLTALLAAVISTDFTKYFIIFHKIFFQNDLWILNPETDLLINIVPEPFFMDTAARIALTFALMTGLLLTVCIFLIHRSKHPDKGQKAASHIGKSSGAALLLLLLLGMPSTEALASSDWPNEVSIASDAGVVMDAHTGVVLYGKNMHDTYAPASITKVLTSLIVLEHCSLDEVVTFSENAVYNVESNSSSAGYDTGDTASVKDCLYALLLKSANESANALAEHVAGTTEDFAVLMNEKAAELGCQDSHFANPSGLNDENHYVSAYDMALITRAAFENDTFSKIVGTPYYELPPNRKNPEGQGISPGNKMIKKNWPEQYRPDVLGGKTGYTSIALNTLVNGAQQGNTKLITVILHSQNTQYEDTSRLLDFGFSNFHSVRIADCDQTFSTIGGDLKIAGLDTSGEPSLTIDPDSRVTLPKTADFSETVISLDYEIPADAPTGTIACVNYFLGENRVGQAYLTLTAPSQNSSGLPENLVHVNPSVFSTGETENLPKSNAADPAVQPDAPLAELMGKDDRQATEEGENSGSDLFQISFRLPPLFWQLLAAILLLGGGGTLGYITFRKKRLEEESAMLERRRRREERLKETGISQAEFDLMMQNRRSNPRDTKLIPDRRSLSRNIKKRPRRKNRK